MTFIPGGFEKDLNATPYYINGKVSFIYYGALDCSYCAMERWAIVMALSQFGSFSNLTTVTSSEDNIGTYNFAGANYNSTKVDFQSYELYDNNHNFLENMSGVGLFFFNKYDSGPIPFLCVAGSIFKLGAGSSFDVNSFTNQPFATIKSQVDSANGNLYNQIVTESNAIVIVVNEQNKSYNASRTYSYNFNYIPTQDLSAPGFEWYFLLISVIVFISFKQKFKKK